MPKKRKSNRANANKVFSMIIISCVVVMIGLSGVQNNDFELPENHLKALVILLVAVTPYYLVSQKKR